MKLSALPVAIALMTISLTSAFAKVDTLHKNYEHQKPTAAAVQQAKSIVAHKQIVLKHPEKMNTLKKEYGAAQQGMCAKHVAGQKAAFVAKAQARSGGYHHDCPYQKDAPKRDCQMKHDAKSMHTMKCDVLQNCGK